MIQDACCDFLTIEKVNQDLEIKLHDLAASSYFRFWKVDLYRECPFWKEDGSCMNRACGVQEVDESRVPAQWRTQSLSHVERLNESKSKHIDDQECYFRDSDFCRVEDLQLSDTSAPFYVDLVENPERFTGYAGPSANKLWRAIYEENCFGTSIPYQDPSRGREDGGSGFPSTNQQSKLMLQPSRKGRTGFGNLIENIRGPADAAEQEQCLEKRVYYRLISGLHASISIHICDEYLDQQTGEWSPNLDCFISRIGEHPERLQNVYFDYVVFLRALVKAGPYLKSHKIVTGDSKEDKKIRKQLNGLLKIAGACETTFDEKGMFVGPDAVVSLPFFFYDAPVDTGQTLKDEFKHHFRNVSRIMDCVGCDKCRLWGGLQVAGLGTALKLLFEDPSSSTMGGQTLDLTRSEIVAFINTLHRFSESLAAIERFRQLWAERDLVKSPVVKAPEPILIEETIVQPSVSEASLDSSMSTTIASLEAEKAASVLPDLVQDTSAMISEPPAYHKSQQTPPPSRFKRKKEPIAFPPQPLAPNIFSPPPGDGDAEFEPFAWFAELFKACGTGFKLCVAKLIEKLGLSAVIQQEDSSSHVYNRIEL